MYIWGRKSVWIRIQLRAFWKARSPCHKKEIDQIRLGYDNKRTCFDTKSQIQEDENRNWRSWLVRSRVIGEQPDENETKSNCSRVEVWLSGSRVEKNRRWLACGGDQGLQKSLGLSEDTPDIKVHLGGKLRSQNRYFHKETHSKSLRCQS